VIGSVHLLFAPRFLLVTFDAEAAQVAGIYARLWSMFLNLSVGVTAAAAVHEIGALLTFSLMTLCPMAALLTADSIRAAFTLSAAIGMVTVCMGLVAAFQLDLPPGPTSVGLLVLTVVAASVARSWRSTQTMPSLNPVQPE
jgi:zinc transport system permease protein